MTAAVLAGVLLGGGPSSPGSPFSPSAFIFTVIVTVTVTVTVVPDITRPSRSGSARSIASSSDRALPTLRSPS
ncbi:hypothetical protein AB0M28_31350 [Streptomyces sp. NPDC051940]|uniref:hypothetical protein n=1 Tax=Streptomyces sp. NPDC051940 TaxID=3155675 RepID=UPI00343A7305